MKFEIEKDNTCYLGDTIVENIFLNEYMPDAPCDFVKVYLLSLSYAQLGGELTCDNIAKQLRITPEIVKNAIEYWVKTGLITKDGEDITFLSMKERLYGNPKKEKTVQSDKRAKLLDDGRISAMFNSIEEIAQIFISGAQMTEILSWIEEYDATTEIIIKAFEYGKQNGKTNLNYVGAIVKNWAKKGIITQASAEKYLSNMDETYYIYRRVMKALGFNRNPGEREREIISSWVDDLGCEMDEILEACGKTSGITNPNINYVDKVLRNRRNSETGKIKVSRNVVMEQYEKLREKAREEAEARKQEVYNKIPGIREIDVETVEISVQMTQNLMKGNFEKNEDLTKELERLEKERISLLVENNIPQDYTEPKYNCRICNDTGLTKEGSICRCYEEISEMARDGNGGK